ncbi:T9SS type A sorting domain-containing protein [Maribacter algicola]|uniref:T9SS type A sorting domain-containing protein n=1 Tax=Meishania litoralis TaxID=3434685 RepID=A0ACC7LI29_9FLAO
MRILYTALFLVLTYALSAQEPLDFQKRQSEETLAFKLYPNPVYDDQVYMIGHEIGPKDIAVYDVFGEVVLTERVDGNTLNISRLVPGVYVVRVVQRKKTVTRKLVVK